MWVKFLTYVTPPFLKVRRPKYYIIPDLYHQHRVILGIDRLRYANNLTNKSLNKPRDQHFKTKQKAPRFIAKGWLTCKDRQDCRGSCISRPTISGALVTDSQPLSFISSLYQFFLNFQSVHFNLLPIFSLVSFNHIALPPHSWFPAKFSR